MSEKTISGKALLTGASGFIGQRLRDRLLREGVDVVAIRREGSPEPSAGRSVVADYADQAGLERILREEKPDYLFHVAGVTKGRTYDDFRAGNVMPTENLLAAARAAHPSLGRFVHVSSLAAYGPTHAGRPLRETDDRKPIEHYGQSKLEAEQVVETAADVPWTIVRPSGVYGPGDVDYLNLFKSAAKGVNVFFGNRDRWFSKVYVDDVVDAVLGASSSPAAVGRGYFLCDGEPITWGAFQDEVVRAVGKRSLTLDLPEGLVTMAAFMGELATAIDGKPRLFNRQKAKMGAQPAWICMHDAAREDFGYAPKVRVNEGVERTNAWYRERGWY